MPKAQRFSFLIVYIDSLHLLVYVLKFNVNVVFFVTYHIIFFFLYVDVVDVQVVSHFLASGGCSFLVV